jgi:hypothetical protein
MIDFAPVITRRVSLLLDRLDASNLDATAEDILEVRARDRVRLARLGSSRANPVAWQKSPPRSDFKSPPPA